MTPILSGNYKLVVIFKTLLAASNALCYKIYYEWVPQTVDIPKILKLLAPYITDNNYASPVFVSSQILIPKLKVNKNGNNIINLKSNKIN